MKGKAYMPWIVASGKIESGEERELIEAYGRNHPEAMYIAFHTDRFSAGYSPSLMTENIDTLLELRVFTMESELRIIRTSISAPFQYRVADETALANNLESHDLKGQYPGEPDCYRFITYQTLDINQQYPPYRQREKDQNHCLLLCTTGGGHYALPLTGDEDTAIVINYLSYDEQTGVCAAADYRLAGFMKYEEGTER